MRETSSEHKKYRKENEVIEGILRFVKQRDKALKTHIMYAANLNTVSLEKFLTRLIEIGAIVPVGQGDRVAYVITPKGEQLLSLLALVRKLMSTSGSYSRNVVNSLNSKDSVKILRHEEVMGKSGVVYRISMILEFADGKSFIMDIIEPDTDLTEGVLRIAKTAFLSKDTGLASVVVLPTEFIHFITLYYSGSDCLFGSNMLFVYYTGMDDPATVAERICSICGYGGSK